MDGGMGMAMGMAMGMGGMGDIFLRWHNIKEVFIGFKKGSGKACFFVDVTEDTLVCICIFARFHCGTNNVFLAKVLKRRLY